VIGPCFEAALTVTLGAPKLPLVLPPARLLAGDLVVADIGIPGDVIEAVEGPRVELLTRESVRELLPERRADAHKGDFGHVLVIAGSRGKTGAAHLAAVGALRSGAGLVTVATPACCQGTVASLGAEYMTEALPDVSSGSVGHGAVEAVVRLPGTVLAIGPGLGGGEPVRLVVRELLERSPLPIVLDADGINAFAGEPGLLRAREGQHVIITPHPGEMARLLGISTAEVQSHRLESARNLATTHGLFVVLKGHRTIIATPEGKVFINPTGNPGMATGGTGDVLTGMIAGWLAQAKDPEAACIIAVYLHGAAGDLAADDEGQVSMTAGDVATHIGDAVMELAARRRVVPREE
jgi:NAD(P)H-hydrate epimerase